MNMNARAGVLVAALLAGNVMLARLTKEKPVLLRQDFQRFPAAIGGWKVREVSGLRPGEANVLKADDYLLRTYERNGLQVGLFVAYYRSQKSGDTMHSPKNCLPGAGWEPVSNEVVRIPATTGTFDANHMLIARDQVQQEVLYWYQANSRIFASEYRGKVYLAYDALRKGRTDGAIVRVIGPYSKGVNTLSPMEDFARELSTVLPQYLPN
jgi:EpsI family protein